MEELTYTKIKKYLSELNELKEEELELKQLRQFAKKNRIPILDEFSSIFYAQLLQISKPRFLLEIGTAIGYSAILAAKNLPDYSKIYTIEKSTDNLRIATENLKKFDRSSKIELIAGDAKVLLPNLAQNFDFIFLDADKQDYLDLLPKIISKLNLGGILFVDNLLWKGEVADLEEKHRKSGVQIIRDFNLAFIKNEQLNSSILPLGDGLGLAIKIK